MSKQRDLTPADLQRRGKDAKALDKGGYIGKHRKADLLADGIDWAGLAGDDDD